MFPPCISSNKATIKRWINENVKNDTFRATLVKMVVLRQIIGQQDIFSIMKFYARGHKYWHSAHWTVRREKHAQEQRIQQDGRKSKVRSSAEKWAKVLYQYSTKSLNESSPQSPRPSLNRLWCSEGIASLGAIQKIRNAKTIRFWWPTYLFNNRSIVNKRIFWPTYLHSVTYLLNGPLEMF